MKIKLKRISVIGLGKLGLPLAACFASRGFPTIAQDLDINKVRKVNKGICPIYEPGLKEMVSAVRGRLIATQDYEEAVSNSDITFILVPTPSRKDNTFSLQHVLDAARRIATALKKKSTYHVVVLTSTVMPGSTGNKLRPLLECFSGKRCGKDFGLCYNPEFVALGSVVKNLLMPDFILIGESDPASGLALEDLYKRFCKNKPPIARMSFINAELTKLAVNTFITAKISFANTLARICELLPGADVDTVTNTLGLDSRIGVKYLKGAIGYGGPCFPRDNLALASLSRSLGMPSILSEATDTFNRRQIEWLKALIKSYLPQGGKVGILGLAYKSESDVAEESQGLLLANTLSSKGYRVIVYDPAAMGNGRRLLKKEIIFSSSAKECIQKADAVIVSTPWAEFSRLSSRDFRRLRRARVVIDCWRILKRVKEGCGLIYVPLGRGVLRRRR